MGPAQASHKPLGTKALGGAPLAEGTQPWAGWRGPHGGPATQDTPESAGQQHLPGLQSLPLTPGKEMQTERPHVLENVALNRGGDLCLWGWQPG